ncbi:pectin lyase-like family protein [Tieghemostelium lacteum]|uniref:Pectin lyase-like family protein n=1 Tax=Tieghemostelium lacteum TaxID=361077 RepID=A0A151ZBZ6_TIELA|nr:pectin lyase-like family protein [Tieghemostelium lacteum]|eukprot:KYQ91470.1 pectin lyase-like family protein [Tieghemostelium lacteum]
MIFYYAALKGNIYSVEAASPCISNCIGNDGFQTFQAALTYLRNNQITSAILLVEAGNYIGINNKLLNFISSVQIKSRTGINTVIDCQGIGNAFNVVNNSMFSVSGITFQNCNSNYGGAIKIQSSNVQISSCTFLNNIGSIGGAIHSYNSQVQIKSSTFTSNTALERGGAIYSVDSKFKILSSTLSCNRRLLSGTSTYTRSDIYGTKSTIELDSSTSTTNSPSFFCGDNTIIFTSLDSNSLCQSTPTQCSGMVVKQPNTTSVCGNNICEISSETCLNCPSDCKSCYFNGLKLVEYKCLYSNVGCQVYSSSPLVGNSISDLMKGIDGPVSAILTGYFRVVKPEVYKFKFLFENIGAQVKINQRTHIESQFFSTSESTFSTYIVDGFTNYFQLSLKSFTKSNKGARSVSFFIQGPDDLEFQPFDWVFYSLNNCGDGVYDAAELTCLDDRSNGIDVQMIQSGNSSCGDGICQEIDPNSCIQDCYTYLTPYCSPVSVRDGSITPGSALERDTLGVLINNQMVWHLPGISHFMFGVNVIDMSPANLPIFNFGYCKDKENRIIEDVYRANFYQLPSEVEAVPLPICTFDVQTSEFADASEYQSSMSSSIKHEAGGSIGGGIGAIHAEASAAYSSEKSTNSAKELNQERTGSLIENQVQCSTSNVRLREFPFHPSFVKAISKLNTDTDFINFFGQYGTHFYREGTLGGKLKQVTKMDSSMSSEFSSDEVSDMSSYSFSVSVSAPVFTASASFSQNQGNSFSTESLNKFSKSSSRSSVITYGGAAGSYGPSRNGPSTFGSWAQTIDLLPVPINFTLQAIRDIIPKAWKTPDGNSTFERWVQAEVLFYQGTLLSQSDLNRSNMIGRWFSKTFISEVNSIAYSSLKFEKNDLYQSESIFVNNANGALLKYQCPFYRDVYHYYDGPNNTVLNYTTPEYKCSFDNALKFQFKQSTKRENIAWKIIVGSTQGNDYLHMIGSIFMFQDLSKSTYFFYTLSNSTNTLVKMDSISFVILPPIRFETEISITLGAFDGDLFTVTIDSSKVGRTTIWPYPDTLRDISPVISITANSITQIHDMPFSVTILSRCAVRGFDSFFNFLTGPILDIPSNYQCEINDGKYLITTLKPSFIDPTQNFQFTSINSNNYQSQLFALQTDSTFNLDVEITLPTAKIQAFSLFN